jgi:signal transduction histidine kinase
VRAGPPWLIPCFDRSRFIVSPDSRPAVADDIVERVRDEMHDTVAQWRSDLLDASDEMRRLVDDLRRCIDDDLFEIKRLRAALRLAAVEVFGHCDPTTTSPDELVQHFIEEARNV